MFSSLKQIHIYEPEFLHEFFLWSVVIVHAENPTIQYSPQLQVGTAK